MRKGKVTTESRGELQFESMSQNKAYCTTRDLRTHK